VSERSPDFAEMALHHLVHLVLVSSSLIANVMVFGAMIAFVHDFSDIGVCLAKMLHLMGYTEP